MVLDHMLLKPNPSTSSHSASLAPNEVLVDGHSSPRRAALRNAHTRKALPDPVDVVRLRSLEGGIMAQLRDQV